MKNKDEVEKNKLDLPDIISNDLTYYMQFGWKRLTDRVFKSKEVIKYSSRIYVDTFKAQEE